MVKFTKLKGITTLFIPGKLNKNKTLQSLTILLEMITSVIQCTSRVYSNIYTEEIVYKDHTQLTEQCLNLNYLNINMNDPGYYKKLVYLESFRND